MLEQLAPWLGQRVLEVGSGIGSFTRFLMGRDLIVATELNPRYLRILGNTFERHTRVEVMPLDLTDFDPAPLAARSLDTILCLNVLEHVEDDREALRRLHASLAPGGRLLLVVPAHQRLYGAIDRAIDHHRRYERPGLAEKLEEAGFHVESMQLLQPDGRRRLVPEQRAAATHPGPELPAPAPEPPGAPPAGRGGRPPAIRAVSGRRRAPVLSRPGPPRGRAEGLRVG